MINRYENDLLTFQLLRFSPDKSFERLDGNLKIEHLWKIIEKAQNHDYKRKKSFNDISKRAINKIARLTIGTTHGFSEDEIDLIGQILVEYHNNMINSIEHNYIYLRRFLEEGLLNQISNPDITDLIEDIKEASELFNEIKFQIQHHKEDLIQIRNEMQLSLDKYVLKYEI